MFTHINVLDVRSGADTISNNTLTNNSGNVTINEGVNSSSHSSTFNLSASDIQNLVGTSTTPTLALKLDSGEVFLPTGTVDTVTSGNTVSYYNSTTHNSTTLLATNTVNTSAYYHDSIVFNAANTAHVNVHYGTG